MDKNIKIETVYQAIRTKILTDIYPGGQKLSEIQLAREYEFSRTPIREILQRLQNDGLIVIKPKSGTYVKNETTKEFVELMQVRASLERLAFSLVLPNAGNAITVAIRASPRTMCWDIIFFSRSTTKPTCSRRRRESGPASC